MKKITLVLVIVLISTMILSACGEGGDSGSSGAGTTEEVVDISAIKTFGDILNLETDEHQWSVFDNKMVFAFQVDDNYYRAISNITDEQMDAIMNVDYSHENYEEEENQIISEFTVDEIEQLNDLIISQEELDKLVGKTGKELFDAGWESGMGYDYGTMEFWMNNGPFMYCVYFDGELTGTDFENHTVEELLSDLTVKSAEFMSFGDATDI